MEGIKSTVVPTREWKERQASPQPCLYTHTEVAEMKLCLFSFLLCLLEKVECL